MSQENIELVRALYAAWNGPNSKEEVLAFLAEDFEFVNPDYAVEPGTQHGHAGWAHVIANLEAAFHDHGHVVEEERDLGNRVLCFTTFVAKTSADSVTFRQNEPHLWTLNVGKVTRLQWFHDRAEALDAAGLTE